MHDGTLQQRVTVLRVDHERLLDVRHAARVGVLVRVLKARHCKQRADGLRLHVNGVMYQGLCLVF